MRTGDARSNNTRSHVTALSCRALSRRRPNSMLLVLCNAGEGNARRREKMRALERRDGSGGQWRVRGEGKSIRNLREERRFFSSSPAFPVLAISPLAWRCFHLYCTQLARRSIVSCAFAHYYRLGLSLR